MSSDSLKKKKSFKVKPFTVLNYLIFVLIVVSIVLPIVKILVDSVDAKASYGMNLWPKDFTLSAYRLIISTVALYKPFLVSCYVTIVGTLFGLTISTIGAYVLIQFDMPGRKLLSYLLLFTMIFSGGMVPTFLAMRELHLTDTLWAIILPASLNVYNLILMRNFFESIPKSLFESAEIDGCAPMGIFIRIVLPLSKAALASIGLMFAVTLWNEYTNFTIYISDSHLMNFQVMLRNLILEDSSLAAASSLGIYQTTVKNASIILAIVPFMVLYPFCQKYFVTGINMGAVKE
jgi:putative aldouronate transport system permease protein